MKKDLKKVFDLIDRQNLSGIKASYCVKENGVAYIYNDQDHMVMMMPACDWDDITKYYEDKNE